MVAASVRCIGIRMVTALPRLSIISRTIIGKHHAIVASCRHRGWCEEPFGILPDGSFSFLGVSAVIFRSLYLASAAYGQHNCKMLRIEVYRVHGIGGADLILPAVGRHI